jgi:hypothetical protein
MDEQRLVHPDIVPGAGLAPARETHWLDPGRAEAAGIEVAIVRGKRDRKPVARSSAADQRLFCRQSDRRISIWRKARLLSRLFVDRAAGTAIGFASGEDRDRGFVFEFPQEIVGNGLEKFAFDGALAPASSSQSLENPHRVLR